MSSSLQDTVDLLPVASFADNFFVDAPAANPLEFGAATHPGRVRKNNEDQYAVFKRSRSTEMLLSSLPPEDCRFPIESTYTLVVADGIGGSQSGEVASRVTLQTVFDLAAHATSWVMRLKDIEAQQIRERVDAYLQRIHKTLQDLGRADPDLYGMGTTWTSAHIFPAHAIIVHLGDSRACLFRDGCLVQITHDETIGQAMIDSGVSPDVARRYHHILTNSLGGKHVEVTAQIHTIPFVPGDQLLLCSDGLSDMLSQAQIAEILGQSATPQSACDALIRQALEAGGKDNVTVVVAAVRPAVG